MIILAIDALEHKLVEGFNCKNLKQDFYGRTNISDFSEPRTMVLWSSFLTGQNKEAEILAKGNTEMWNTKISIQDSFLRKFRNPLVIDLPGYSYSSEQHKRERELLKRFFMSQSNEEKEQIKVEYNHNSFNHHKQIKEKIYLALNEDHDLIIAYFSVADVIGHLSFGNTELMRSIYQDLDSIAAEVRASGRKVLILSDHGMKAIGRFGDHSDYGFWSTNFDAGLSKPKITDFYDLIISQQTS